MIPYFSERVNAKGKVVASGLGTSFKGAFAYYGHDKRTDEEREAGVEIKTANRVEWSEFRNLAARDCEQAWRIMAATAMRSEELKKQAGAAPGGRKSNESVLAYSLSWHPTQNPDRAEMMRAAEQTIELLGAGDHQAAIIAHNDTDHKHVHVIINRVSPENGKMLNLHLPVEKVNKWALEYQKEQGKIYWDKWLARQEANGRRTQFMTASHDMPRHIRPSQEFLQAKNDNAPRMDRSLETQRKLDAQLAQDGAAISARHSAEKLELTGQYIASKKGIEQGRKEALEETARRQAEERKKESGTRARIRESPEEVLTTITGEKSVFTAEDIDEKLRHYLGKDFSEDTMQEVLGSSRLVELQAATGEQAARYSTREMIALERQMAANAQQMAAAKHHGTGKAHVDEALAKANREIQIKGGSGLSDEQREAVQRVTGAEGISCIIGAAGAGKSTMLGAAREAWEAQGYRVLGGALAGKAADGLEQSSGIESRTLASLEYRLTKGQERLSERDILVIDEAGMIGSNQLSRFVEAAKDAGAKLVLVGDHEQLQAINAGAAFRTIAERTGAGQLQEVRRQNEDWQREASKEFANENTGAALDAYGQRGFIRFSKDPESQQESLVADYLKDRAMHPDKSRVALAHSRENVHTLNEGIREGLKAGGELGQGQLYKTREGSRFFSEGDRLVFLENSRDLNVKNGMLGTITRTRAGKLNVRLDEGGRSVAVDLKDYAALDHGYATTIHKSQGATVDRAFVLGTRSMERHLTYVAMTRHREAVTLYANGKQDTFFEAVTRSGAKESTLDYAKPSPAVERRSIRAEFSARRFNLGSWFSAAKKRLSDRHSIEARKLREAWKTRNAERKAALDRTAREITLKKDAGDKRRSAKSQGRADKMASRAQDKAQGRAAAHQSAKAAKRAAAAQNAGRSPPPGAKARSQKGHADFNAASPDPAARRRAFGKQAAGASKPGGTIHEREEAEKQDRARSYTSSESKRGADGAMTDTTRAENKRGRTKDRKERKERDRSGGRERSRSRSPGGG